jgi:hypothetical protein
MTRRRLLCGLFAILLASLPHPGRSWAQSDRITLDVPELLQDVDVWCWVAVAEMLVTYYRGRAPEQCRMLEIGYGLPRGACCSNPQRCRRPGHLDETRRLIEHFSGQQARVTGAPARPSQVARALDRNRAIVAAIQPPGQPIGHVVVVRGIRRGHDGRIDLLVNDPMSQVPNTIPWEQFRPLWRQSIIVRFDDGPEEED